MKIVCKREGQNGEKQNENIYSARTERVDQRPKTEIIRKDIAVHLRVWHAQAEPFSNSISPNKQNRLAPNCTPVVVTLQQI